MINETMPTSNPSAPGSSIGASVMQGDGYKAYSHSHYKTHTFSHDMLMAATNRVISCLEKVPRPLRLVDLGPADGTNSMNTLKFLVESMTEPKPTSMHITFDEHPDSDEQLLREVLHSHEDWFHQNNIEYDVLMKSFYEPLFDHDSIDMFISYICLHWLDTTSADESISSWKKFGGNTRTGFVFAQENGVPESVVDRWKEELALPHLAKFLTLRAKELSCGGEMALVMVGAPFAWVVPSLSADDSPRPSLLTEAIRRCVDRGTVRSLVLEHAIVPYYLRSMEDLDDALAMSNQELVDLQLDMVESRTLKLNVGVGDEVSMEHAFQMLWAVHQGAIRAGGASDDEMKSIRDEACTVSQQWFDPSTGVEVTYLACTIRRSR